MKRILSLHSIVLIATFGLHACNGDLYQADTVITRAFGAGIQHVDVSLPMSGDIVVLRSADVTTSVDVALHAGGSTQANADSNLASIAIDMTVNGDTLHVTGNAPFSWGAGIRSASPTLHVPDGTTLNLSTDTGSVLVNGAFGQTVAHVATGEINVQNTVGQLDLRTSTGSISVQGGAGPLLLETATGGITVTSELGNVTSRTSSGSISFTGPPVAGSHSFTTSSGGITLTLSPDASFTVDAQTSNGQVTSAFPVAVGSGGPGLQGTVGSSPTSSLTVRVSNGDISLRKGL